MILKDHYPSNPQISSIAFGPEGETLRWNGYEWVTQAAFSQWADDILKATKEVGVETCNRMRHVVESAFFPEDYEEQVRARNARIHAEVIRSLDPRNFGKGE